MSINEAILCLWFYQGGIVERGMRHHLIEEGGIFYSQMYENQLKGEIITV